MGSGPSSLGEFMFGFLVVSALSRRFDSLTL